jgi:hypothetical protein
MTSLILAISLMLQTTTATAAIVPPLDVQEKVTPILDLCAVATTSQGERQNVASWQAAKLIAKLADIKTNSSDEALVVLMSFYIGEATGEDLLHQVTVRGKRMLPLLLKYHNSSIIFSQKNYPSSLLLAADVKKQNFDEVIKSVRAGKVIGEN